MNGWEVFLLKKNFRLTRLHKPIITAPSLLVKTKHSRKHTESKEDENAALM